ncbi:acyltransferase family protein [Corallococcus carmarthensis]|uniref:Acyltransferase n=1 Tax=Corallococcus carmarthensis TaxID=2316728 RepID=A0A3A8K0H3_9BACT|nr:acyltransferase [Corallococcus carmarthensis]NOK20489.1 acyltransferase [Corallococcus carmarthensis]RKH00966.1 acyltransferase [Corallococcus carmarthensis]
MASPPRPLLPALTGLRFLAALHVVAFHVTPREGRPGWLGALLDNGPASVTLFFILSGFVLAQAYLGEGAPLQVPRRAFWAARFARVYPVYLLGLVLEAPPFLLFVLRQEGGLTGDALQRVLGVGAAVFSLTQAWVPSAACVWNCPGWSLSVEAFFYLLFPWVAASVARLGPGRSRWALLALVVASALPGGVWLLGDGWLASDAATRETWLRVSEYSPLLKLPQFLLGVVLGRAFVLRRAGGPGWSAAVGSCAAAGLALALLWVPWQGRVWALRELLLTPVFAWLLWTLAAGRGPLAAWLSRAAMVRLGEASYALYILHIPLAFHARTLERVSGLGLELRAPWAYCALAVTSFVLVSLGVFTWAEEPARRWLRDRLARPRPAPTAASSGLL